MIITKQELHPTGTMKGICIVTFFAPVPASSELCNLPAKTRAMLRSLILCAETQLETQEFFGHSLWSLNNSYQIYRRAVGCNSKLETQYYYTFK
jgi:hypothetical protein